MIKYNYKSELIFFHKFNYYQSFIKSKYYIFLHFPELICINYFFFSSRRRHTRSTHDWSSDVCSSDLPLVARIKDHSLRVEYSQALARMAGVDDPDRVLARVRGVARSGGAPDERRVVPVVDGAVASVEREALKIAMQMPAVAGPTFDALPDDAFLVPAHVALRQGIAAAGGTAGAVSGPAWAGAVEEQLPDLESRGLVHALAVEPLHDGADSQERYADA